MYKSSSMVGVGQTPFGALSRLWVMRDQDGAYRLGAGSLMDGLIVPVFIDESNAKNAITHIREYDPSTRLHTEALGDPYQAMVAASRQGAAGFQCVIPAVRGEVVQSTLDALFGRTLFPFLVRNEEAGVQWPTVLGSASRCSADVYLTRRGPQHLEEGVVRQWVRWDVMDFANAAMTASQPLRSHDPGESFWCLDHRSGSVAFTEDGEHWFGFDGPATVLFAKDAVLRQYTPPEGYFPVFSSKEAAEVFLGRRLGGAFHILSESNNRGIPNLNMVSGVLAQELGPKGALNAKPIEVTNLPCHLSAVAASLPLPPCLKFVINPAGHREDCAWGRFPNQEVSELTLRSVGGLWRLSETHDYALIEEVKQHRGEDTFFLGVTDYRFAQQRRSLGVWSGSLRGEDLVKYSDAERADALREYLESEEACEIAPPSSWDREEEFHDPADVAETHWEALEIQEDVQFSRSWVLHYWETLDGERSKPIFFDNPIALIKCVLNLERNDRPARVHGAHGYSSIGFDGSHSHQLEDAVGTAFESTLRRMMESIVSRGYQPQDGLNLQALANATLKSFRVTVCGCVADLLTSHLPRSDEDFQSLCVEMGISSSLGQRIVELLANDVDPAARELLVSRIGLPAFELLVPQTKLFLATAFLQFEHFGGSTCVDYAPVSLQIVKALEFEIRALVADCVAVIDDGKFSSEPNKYEQTLIDSRNGAKERLSLGSLVHAIRKSRTMSGSPFEDFHRQLESRGVAFLSQERTTKYILGDVLNRFRNGGAHDSAIALKTCEGCIESLVGTAESPGLLPRLLVWRVSR